MAAWLSCSWSGPCWGGEGGGGFVLGVRHATTLSTFQCTGRIAAGISHHIMALGARIQRSTAQAPPSLGDVGGQ